jgi:peptide/nickel transport system permease protein
VTRYLARKLFVYWVTFIAAVTIDWSIPHMMPGNPVLTLMGRIQIQDPKVAQHVYDNYMRSFNLDLPLWKQYYYFWVSLLHGDLGTSILQFPSPVSSIIVHAVPYTLGLLLPAILLSWWVGNKLGALAARRKVLDNTVLPLGYMLTATPYMWLAIVLVWVFAITLGIVPVGFAYSPTAGRGWSEAFILDLLHHWVLPFLSLFLVALGGWAIGMRNMIIYELESDYAHYLEALGAPRRLVRKYAFRNAMLPQISGLALSLGAVIAGALVTEIVFSYPGLGYQIYRAITNEDYFVIQGIFLFIIVGVLIANFVVDLVYVIIDPRTRIGMEGGGQA